MSERHEQHDPAAELTALEQELLRLTPRFSTHDRDQILFRAGRASAPRSWGWPAAAVAASTVAVVLATVLIVQPPPQVVESRVYVPVPQPSPPFEREPVVAIEDPGESAEIPAIEGRPAHLRLQDHLLRWGVDGLGRPVPPVPGPNPERLADLFSSH